MIEFTTLIWVYVCTYTSGSPPQILISGLGAAQEFGYFQNFERSYLTQIYAQFAESFCDFLSAINISAVGCNPLKKLTRVYHW